MQGSARSVQPARPRARSRVLAACAVLLLGVATASRTDADAEPRPELARGSFLVASEALLDPNFRETVVLLLEHGANGSLGVVINRPTDVKLALLLPEVVELARRQDKIFLGGPVGHDRMVLLVRTPSQPAESALVLDGVFVTARLDVLRELATTSPDAHSFRAYVGFAGWAPAQLAAEVERGDWSVLRGEAASVFDQEPSEVWRALKERASGQWVLRPPAVRVAALP